MPRDLILSSGFLAFARHVGVVAALRQAGEVPDAIVGTSSGAVVAALVCAGVDPLAALTPLVAAPPWRAMRLSSQPWRGLFEAAGLRAMLYTHLPERFEDLPVPLAVGVVGPGRRHALLTQGPLVPAVLASCAMPGIFAAVDVQGTRWADGGAADRLGLQKWRQWRPGRQAWVHRVRRSAGVDLHEDRSGTVWIESPRSGASFWSLGDFAGQVRETQALARQVIAAQRSGDEA